MHTKWKYLRETFGKKYQENCRGRSGDSAEETSVSESWPHFRILMFLKNQFTSRKTTGNLTKQFTKLGTQQEVQHSAQRQVQHGAQHGAYRATQEVQLTTQVPEKDIEVSYNIPEYNVTYIVPPAQQISETSNSLETTSTASHSLSSAPSQNVLEETPVPKRAKRSGDPIGHALVNIEQQKLKGELTRFCKVP